MIRVPLFFAREEGLFQRLGTRKCENGKMEAGEKMAEMEARSCTIYFARKLSRGYGEGMRKVYRRRERVDNAVKILLSRKWRVFERRRG